MRKGVKIEPVVLEELTQSLVCGDPGCDETHDLIMSAECHPDNGLLVGMCKGQDFLTLTCFVCDSVVAEIAIAKKADQKWLTSKK